MDMEKAMEEEKPTDIQKSRLHTDRELQITQQRKEADKLSKSIISKKVKLDIMIKKSQKPIAKTILLGTDHLNKQYWLFKGDMSKVFVYHQNKWHLYFTKEKISALLEYLSDKGINEKNLKQAITDHELNKCENSLLPKSEVLTIIDDVEPIRHSARIYNEQQKKLSEIIITEQSLISNILYIEEKFTDFFTTKLIEWTSDPEIKEWREKAAQITQSSEISKWFLIFVSGSMAPFKKQSDTPIPRYYKPRDCDDFLLEDILNNNEINSMAGESEENQSERKKMTLTPLIWRNKGWDLCKAWVAVLNQAKGLTEFKLCIAFFESLLDDAYNYIIEAEKKKEEKIDEIIKYDHDIKKNTRKHKPANLGSDMVTDVADMVAKTPPSNRELRKRCVKTNYNESEILEWDEFCYICGEYGEIICCDTCSNAAHLDCVGLKHLPEGMWQCERCLLKFNTSRQTRSQLEKLKKINEKYVSDQN